MLSLTVLFIEIQLCPMFKLRINTILWVPLFLTIISCEKNEGDGYRLLSKTPVSGGLVTDVWGFTQNNMEYAVIGTINNESPYGNITIFDISDPAQPEKKSEFALKGFDIKYWNKHLYVSSGGTATTAIPGGIILDVTDPSMPEKVGEMPPSHNFFIDEYGYMYLAGGSIEIDSVTYGMPYLRIYDLNNDPAQPQEIFATDTATSHDVAVINNYIYLFNALLGTIIYHNTNPHSPEELSTLKLPEKTYDHSGWVTKDGNYLFICNELSPGYDTSKLKHEPVDDEWGGIDVYIWDISNKSNPVKVGEIDDQTSRVHNLYIIDDLAYISYYDAGLKIYNVSKPTKPELIYQYDTNGESASQGYGRGFVGAFGVYPFTTSGNILVSDTENGLMIFGLN